jgi:hypothetical protein
MTAPEPLRCAGCGIAGTEPRIIWDRSTTEAQIPVLRPTFGWRPDRPALLCNACLAAWRKPRRRRKAAAPGRLPL